MTSIRPITPVTPIYFPSYDDLPLFELRTPRLGDDDNQEEDDNENENALSEPLLLTPHAFTPNNNNNYYNNNIYATTPIAWSNQSSYHVNKDTRDVLRTTQINRICNMWKQDLKDRYDAYQSLQRMAEKMKDSYEDSKCQYQQNVQGLNTLLATSNSNSNPVLSLGILPDAVAGSSSSTASTIPHLQIQPLLAEVITTTVQQHTPNNNPGILSEMNNGTVIAASVVSAALPSTSTSTSAPSSSSSSSSLVITTRKRGRGRPEMNVTKRSKMNQMSLESKNELIAKFPLQLPLRVYADYGGKATIEFELVWEDHVKSAKAKTMRCAFLRLIALNGETFNEDIWFSSYSRAYMAAISYLSGKSVTELINGADRCYVNVDDKTYTIAALHRMHEQHPQTPPVELFQNCKHDENEETQVNYRNVLFKKCNEPYPAGWKAKIPAFIRPRTIHGKILTLETFRQNQNCMN